VKQIALAIARLPRGVEFGAVDGERVRLVLLLVSPKDGNTEHLAAMKSIVSIARDPYQRQRLMSCGTPESFLDLLAELGGPKA
jgi:mannitol/fructose-specific phosphotransferase system IIA component (Ntr-type)